MQTAAKVSKGLEDFLSYLRHSQEQNRIAAADCTQAEAATQDILHTLELDRHDRTGRDRLARKLAQIRKDRRKAKDILLQTDPLVEWAKQHSDAIISLEQVLGNIRKAERRTATRAYTPRTQAVDEALKR